MHQPHVITLPMLPPSVNHLFINVPRRGRVPSRHYTSWRLAMEAVVRAAKPRRFEGPVSVEYFFARPDRRRRDLGNLEKATSDLLVTAGVLADDSLIQDMRLAWGSVEPVTIIISEVERLAPQEEARRARHAQLRAEVGR